jgi:hypothetical protein
MNVKPIFGSPKLPAAAKAFKEKLPSPEQLFQCVAGGTAGLILTLIPHS